MSSARSGLISAVIATMAVSLLTAFAPPGQAAPSPTGDDTPVLLTPKGEHDNGSDEASFDKLRDAYYSTRLLAGDNPLTLTQAATLRSKASTSASKIASATSKGAARGGTWTSQGPSPIVQVARTSNTFQAMSGRIGALAIRNDGTIILGAAQGGVWTYNAAAGTWTSRTNDTDTQSVGALAIAPSNDNIVYMGSGEGALSGDSYSGDGVYRSTDGGVTWTHVSSKFTGQAVSDIVVDPANANHLFASTLRGRGGVRRTTAPTAVPFGVWESTDAGANWTLRKGTTDEFHGATDLVMDPQHASVLWASFWGDGIYRSTDGGLNWSGAMGDLPAGQFVAGATRFSLGLSHPAADGQPTVYAGFDYTDLGGTYHKSSIFKTTDSGAHWTNTPTGTGIKLGSRILRDPVLLRQRGQAGPDQPGRPLRRGFLRLRQLPAVGRHLPLDRRRADLEEPRLRPAPRLPRDRLPTGPHLAHRDRQRRWRLGLAHRRWAQRRH